MEPPDALRAFRRSFYECLHRRGEALFELADAILAADGAAAPSPAHLSLQASHRRGWGSLYAALNRGQIDDEALRKLLTRHPLASTEGETPVYAVDASVWLRCDAETSPERGYYSHPSRPLRRPAHRRRLGLAVRRPAQLRPRELDGPRGRGARPARPRRQRGRCRAGEGIAGSARRRRGRPSVRLRRGLRPRQVAAGARGEPVPDPRPLAGGASLLRRPWHLRSARARRTPPSPRAEDEVQRPGHLA